MNLSVFSSCRPIVRLSTFLLLPNIRMRNLTRRRAALDPGLKSKVGLHNAKPLCINLNDDGCPFSSRAHTYPSHSQTSRLLSTSLSLYATFPRPI